MRKVAGSSPTSSTIYTPIPLGIGVLFRNMSVVFYKNRVSHLLDCRRHDRNVWMRISGGSLDVSMSHELLDRSNVSAACQRQRGEGVTAAMRRKKSY